MTKNYWAKITIFIVAMILLFIPEPSGGTKWISGFLFGVLAK